MGEGKEGKVPFFPIPYPAPFTFLLSPHFPPATRMRQTPSRGPNFVRLEQERLPGRPGGACPFKVRSDCGTKNGVLAAGQCEFRGSADAHSLGSSPANERIQYTVRIPGDST